MEWILSLMGDGLVHVGNSEIGKMTLAFIIAARLHRKWVKADVIEQVSALTKSIDNMSEKLSKGIQDQGLRIDDLSHRVNVLENKGEIQ